MTGHNIIFVLFGGLLAQGSYCQTATPEALPQAISASVKEKIYVHTDKNVYVAGEILWCKLYNIITSGHQLSALSQIAYVELMDSLNKPVAQIKIGLHNGTGNGSFMLSPAVSSGSYKIRAYTSWMKNGSPDDFFQKDIAIINVQKLTIAGKSKEEATAANRSHIAEKHPDSGGQGQIALADDQPYRNDSLLLLLSGEKSSYSTREKVTLSVAASHMKGSFDSAFLSVSVYRIDSLQAIDDDNITNCLMDASMPGKKSRYRNGSGDDPVAGREENRAGKSSFAFAPEYNGHIITGTVLSKDGQPQSGVTAYLSVPGKGTQFYSGVSDADGNIRWETKDFYGSTKLVIQTGEDSGYTIKVDDPFSQSVSAAAFPRFTLPYNCPNTLSEHGISMQVSHIYSEAKLAQYQQPRYDTVPFYARADKTYWLDDFTRFNTLEEVMREYVALANVTRRRGDFHLPVFDMATQKMFTADPLLLLDGVPCFNFNRFMSLDPQGIQKLDVVFHRFFYGNSIFDGILNWQSYNGELAEASLDAKAFVTDYEGLALQREFFSPSYETEEQQTSHLPDFRNVLYWNPDMVLKDKGEFSFYTSDLPGKYVAVVQGITQSGLPGSQTITFEVKK